MAFLSPDRSFHIGRAIYIFLFTYLDLSVTARAPRAFSTFSKEAYFPREIPTLEGSNLGRLS